MYPTIARVRFWDQCEDNMKEENYFFYAKSMSDAMEILTNWFGDDMDKVTIEQFDMNLIPVSDEFCESVRQERW